MAALSAAAKAARNRLRIQVLKQFATGLVAASIPVAVWWKWASDDRNRIAEEIRTKIRIPGVQTTDDRLLEERILPGDVLLFDRRCEKCAAGPWAALACLAGREFLCDDGKSGTRTVDTGRFDHIGLVVPGYAKTVADEFDPSNLLILEATPSGIVTRSLKTRLERTQSRSVILLQLACPGERRNPSDYERTEPSQTVIDTRAHVDRELKKFRDRWTELSQESGYHWLHSTIALGGAMHYALGLQQYMSGPVSPSAYLVLMGLQRAAAAQNISEKENTQIKVEDFLRDYRFEEANAVRLRPGWRFLAPMPVRETSRS